MPIEFNFRPICEVCKSEPAEALIALQASSRIVWVSGGKCADKENHIGYPIYDIGFDKLFGQGTGVLNWLGQLGQKKWFEPEEFGKALTRLARQTGAHP